MPDNNDGLNTMPMPEEVEGEESEQGWGWVGSPDHPDAKKSSDGISDLFQVDDDPDTDDLVEVDIEHDIMDGDLSDVTDVTEEDIIGDDIYGQSPLDDPNAQRLYNASQRQRLGIRKGIIRRPMPPPMTGMQGMSR